MTHEDQEDAAVAAAFARVGPRTPPPGHVREAVYAATRVAWQQQMARRRRRRMWQMALAAGVACVAVGTVVLVNRSLTGHAVLIEAALAPPADATLAEAGPEGRRLPAPGGEMLRLQPGSRIATRGSDLWLLRGAVYVESDGIEGSGALVVNAGGVQVRHVGTRYAVALNDGAVDVLVRDGMVEVRTGVESERAGGGESLSLAAGSRQLRRGPIQTWGPAWSWADELAPPLVIDGMLISAVLQDIAHQTGRLLEFDDDAVRRICETSHLNGPVLDLSAAGRLLAVLAATDLEAVENEERIVIRRKAE